MTAFIPSPLQKISVNLALSPSAGERTAPGAAAAIISIIGP
jgi:hypothetical protein